MTRRRGSTRIDASGVTSLADVVAPERRDALAAALRDWVPRQRWFAGKARTVTELVVADTVLFDDAAGLLDVLVDVAFDDGHAERYQVPLAAGTPDAPEHAVVATTPNMRLVDAVSVPDAAVLLAAHTSRAASITTQAGGEVRGCPLDGGGAPDLGAPRLLGAEQSNTSIVFGDRLIAKVFRKLEPGENPDVEVTRALTDAGFGNAPRQHGCLRLHAADGSVTALAVLSDFVAGGREGWSLATAEVARLGDSPVGCALADPWLLDRVGDLGRVVAEMHAVLRDALGSRAARSEDLAGWVAQMRRQAERVLSTAATRAPQAAAAVLQRRDELGERFERLRTETATGPLTRTHGDLHLGQVLLDRDDRWQLLDFEGEPARPLAERRDLHLPLRDVAGMLRSFDYAAAAGSRGDLSAVPEAAAAWRDEARRRFLDGYLDTAAGDALLPAGEPAVRAQLDAFELDKAVYELGYELANRPGWVPVPVGGITRVLARQA